MNYCLKNIKRDKSDKSDIKREFEICLYNNLEKGKVNVIYLIH